MKFEAVYGRRFRGEPSRLEAAAIRGMCEPTLRHRRDGFEAEAAGARISRRLPGRLAPTQVPRPHLGRRHADREPPAAGRAIRFDATGRRTLWIIPAAIMIDS